MLLIDSLPLARVVLHTHVKMPGSLCPTPNPAGATGTGGMGEAGAGLRAEGLGLSQLPRGTGKGC